MRAVQSTGAPEVVKAVLMAESVRSPFDYREPPTLDSDGDGSKPPPPRGVPELGEEGASGVRGPVLFHPPPNCRIREVHCGTQVRLVVIAIRDIAKGEEITVDYSLTDWGENPM
ncbi:hypothetical protein GOODEAATRI_027858, partial [Goodea atripinnis]